MVTTPFRLIQSAMPELERYKYDGWKLQHALFARNSDSNSHTAKALFFSGSVVLLSSSLGLSPTVDVGTYAVANTSLLAMTKSLALSAARKGVRVNGVCNAMVGPLVIPKNIESILDRRRRNECCMGPQNGARGWKWFAGNRFWLNFSTLVFET